MDCEAIQVLGQAYYYVEHITDWLPVHSIYKYCLHRSSADRLLRNNTLCAAQEIVVTNNRGSVSPASAADVYEI